MKDQQFSSLQREYLGNGVEDRASHLNYSLASWFQEESLSCAKKGEFPIYQEAAGQPGKEGVALEFE